MPYGMTGLIISTALWYVDYLMNVNTARMNASG